MFRLEVEETHKNAFNHQLAEAVMMKNSISIVLNMRDEYARCLIPDIPLVDRGRVEGGPQRQEAVTNKSPRKHERHSVAEIAQEDKEKKTQRRKILTVTKLTRITRM